MIKINLLPVKQAKKRGAGQQQIVLFVIVLVAVGLALYFVYGEQKSKIEKLDREKQAVNTEIARLQELIGDIEVFQKKRDDLKKKLDVIEVLKKGKSGPVRVLDEISTLIPKKVWLTSLVEGGGKLNFEGQALDNKEIAAFMKNLESSKFFKAVTLVTVQRAADTGNKMKVQFSEPVMSFKIVCDYSIPQS